MVAKRCRDCVRSLECIGYTDMKDDYCEMPSYFIHKRETSFQDFITEVRSEFASLMLKEVLGDKIWKETKEEK